MQTCRPELLDRTLTWNSPAFCTSYESLSSFYNGHRPHQGIASIRQGQGHLRYKEYPLGAKGNGKNPDTTRARPLHLRHDGR